MKKRAWRTLVVAGVAVLVALGVARFRAVRTPAPLVKTNPIDGAEMVYVPECEFIMGSDDSDATNDEKPAHKVSLDGYWIYRYDVTVAQYRRFCKATGHKMSIARDLGWNSDHPIVDVTWEDAKAYCDWAGVGLPTEAQWEKAARGTDGRKYPWGNQWDARKCANSVGTKFSRTRVGRRLEELGLWAFFFPHRLLSGTQPVGSYPEDVSPYGVCDMAGNVCQWCADWYDENYYRNSPARNPTGPTGPTSGKGRVLRGGSWWRINTGDFRCSNRDWDVPGTSNRTYGFRCVSR